MTRQERQRETSRRQWERDKNDPARLARKRATARAWRARNGKRHVASTRLWRALNPERWKALKRRRKRTPARRIAANLRKRMRLLIRQGRMARGLQYAPLVGCTPAALVTHLGALFKPGMTWENYGLWEVDHARPLASFDLRDAAQRRSAFHFTNLQPLWACENRAKGATWDEATLCPTPG